MIEKVEMHYKIRNKSDGRYSLGGQWPRWDERGKVWKKIGHIKSHLAQFNTTPHTANDPYKNCELITQRVTVIYEETKVESLDDVVLEAAHQRQKKVLKRKKEEAAYQLEQARKRFEELKKQLGE